LPKTHLSQLMGAPEMNREGSKQITQCHCHQADIAAPKLHSNLQLSVERSQPQTVRYKSGTFPHTLKCLYISKKQRLSNAAAVAVMDKHSRTAESGPPASHHKYVSQMTNFMSCTHYSQGEQSLSIIR
jgi:hypothetical protein